MIAKKAGENEKGRKEKDERKRSKGEGQNEKVERFQDREGSAGTSEDNPTAVAIKKIRARFGDSLLIACDVCLCPYSLDGHCGVIDPATGLIENEPSLERIAAIALNFAKAGADIVAPSDMMDGRIAKIKEELRKAKLENKVS